MNVAKEKAQGQAKLLESKAVAEATVSRLKTQREALMNVKTTLKLQDKLDDSAANKLLSFMWVYVSFCSILAD